MRLPAETIDLAGRGKSGNGGSPPGPPIEYAERGVFRGPEVMVRFVRTPLVKPEGGFLDPVETERVPPGIAGLDIPPPPPPKLPPPWTSAGTAGAGVTVEGIIRAAGVPPELLRTSLSWST
jgi:hypothetical protein